MSEKKFKPETMIPGKRYKGYGFLNEFKQFCFEPEATGSQAGREKLIVAKDDISVSKTKHFILIKIKCPISLNEAGRVRHLMEKFNLVYKTLRDYEI